MTPQPPQRLLTIERDDVGNTIISRFPFQSVFTKEEFQEIEEYCASHSTRQEAQR